MASNFEKFTLDILIKNILGRNKECIGLLDPQLRYFERYIQLGTLIFIRGFRWLDLGPVHTNPFSNQNGAVLLGFSKRFASTLIVFVSFSPDHTTTLYPF